MVNIKHTSKKSLSLLIFLFAIHLNIFSQNPNPNSALDAFIQDEMETERLPGVSTIIVKDGEIVWLESYGYADIENNILVQDSTVFLLASISKIFTGTAAMQLHENETLHLDDDINNFLPWNIANPNYPNQTITFRQLMAHTSSIQDNGFAMESYYDYPDPSISLSDCMQRYFSTSGIDYDPFDNFLNDAPATAYEYSNMATALNGYLVERATQTPFDVYCDDNIFAPLCMSKTAWFMSAFDTSHVARPYQYAGGDYVPYAHYGFADYPNGQLRSNTLDLGNFMIACLSGGTLGQNTILSQSAISEMWSPQFSTLDERQGLNWYQEELYHSNGTAWLWGHNGGESGASTDMYLDPVNNIGICILTNGEGDALYICDELYDYALSLNPTASIVPNCDEVVSFTENEQHEKTIRVFPNPTTHQLTFDLSSMNEKSDIAILSIEGKELFRKNGLTPDLHHIPLQLPFGFYYYAILNSDMTIKKLGKFVIAN